MGGALLLGIMNGLLISLVAMGIVLIFKTGKYINFAQAQLGIVPMLLLSKFVIQWHVNWYVSFLIAIVIGAAFGAAAELLAIRPLAKLGPNAILVGTLGISQVLLGLAYFQGLSVPLNQLIALGYPVPFHSSFTINSQTFFSQHILTLIAVPVIALALYAFLNHSLTGKSIRAAASNEEAARLAGIDIRFLSTLAWVVAGVLATVAAVLAQPNTPGFDPGQLGPGLMLRALGAAALAGFTSFPQAVAASVVLGAIEQGVISQTSNTAEGTLAVFVAIVLGLLLRRRSAALRGTGGLRGTALRPGIPPIIRNTPTGRIARVAAPLVLLAIFAVIYAADHRNANLFKADSIVIAVLGAVSVSLLAGMTGQLSLGQFAVVGMGAMIAAKLAASAFTSLPLMLLVVGLIAAVITTIISLPAARIGPTMAAVTTLGFTVAASSWLFIQQWLLPKATSFSVIAPAPALRFFGIGSISSGKGVFFELLIVGGILLALATLVLRSPLGIRMRASRFSENGARAIGVSPGMMALVGIALAGFMAAAAGVLDVQATSGFAGGFGSKYDPQISLTIMSIAVIGGLGSIWGPAVAAVGIYGIPLFLIDWEQRIGLQSIQLQLFLGGALLVLNLALNPGGIAAVMGATVERIARRRGEVTDETVVLAQREAGAEVASHAHPEEMAATAAAARTRGEQLLDTRDVSISFGPVRALAGVTLKVHEGEIVGLIGNNGAGKTTLINVVSGVLKADVGQVELFSEDATRWRVVKRARGGLGRTFQDATLFEGLTVEEVVELAARQAVTGRESRNGSQSPKEAAREAMGGLGLTPYARVLTADLPTGVRRLVELAVQVARRPRLILLDEPAAGLGQHEVEQFAPVLRETIRRIGCGVLMVEHDLPLMFRLADRIYCLELGTVIAEGTPEEIRADPVVIESYFGSPGGVGARRSGALEEVVATVPGAPQGRSITDRKDDAE